MPAPLLLVALAAAAVLALPSTASAYIGPGAGFALLSSFFVLLTTMVLALVALLRWPFRLLWRAVRGGRKARPLIRRLIVIGFDGQEPSLTDRYLADGKLPNFAALAKAGCYHRLKTTNPPVSPVAWSSFSTGTNPGRHNIFDFLDRDKRSYLPLLSSTRIGSNDRVLRLGPYRIPLRAPELRLLRKSQPFWSLLGEARVWSTVLRVPITFPPDRFHGAQLSAMAAPDLLGTQGTFLLYTTRPSSRPNEESDGGSGGGSGKDFKEGGIRVSLTFNGDRAETRITGPANPLRAGTPPLELPMTVTRDRAAKTLTIDVSGQRVTLAAGALSDWIPLAFKAAPFVKVRGLCRMQATEIGATTSGGTTSGDEHQHVSLYVSPISLDPEHPAMPISHPSWYATYLAKKIGRPYSTLGLAEDTWALNEGVIDDETFLKQTWDIDRERQDMCSAALERLREGSLVCVFDATDRVQHMFWRHVAQKSNAIEEQYKRNDAFLGQVMSRLTDGDVLMVLSDHGFNAFRRGVNLNRWLLDHGYLALKPGADGRAEWLRDVDWPRTRAYALGLTGLFLNVKGRESQGIVAPGSEAAALKAELIAKLSGLADGGNADGGKVGGGKDVVAIREMFDTAVIYDGPYTGNAPDLLAGYNTGYRVSWDCASGVVSGPLFEDNTKAWSGDHCIDPRLVPGVFFCSRPIDKADPALIDIAPTALQLFGVEIPRHIEGTPLFGKSVNVGSSEKIGSSGKIGSAGKIGKRAT